MTDQAVNVIPEEFILKIQSASSEEENIKRKGRSLENIKKLNKKNAKILGSSSKKTEINEHEFIYEQLEAKGEEADYHHRQVNTLMKGSILLIEDKPSKITDKTVSKTGKHGHAKANIQAVEVFGGKKIETSLPSGHSVKCPNMIQKTEIITGEEAERNNNMNSNNDMDVIYTIHILDADMKPNKYIVGKEDYDKIKELRAQNQGSDDKVIMVQSTAWRDYIMFEFKVQVEGR